MTAREIIMSHNPLFREESESFFQTFLKKIYLKDAKHIELTQTRSISDLIRPAVDRMIGCQSICCVFSLMFVSSLN